MAKSTDQEYLLRMKALREMEDKFQSGIMREARRQKVGIKIHQLLLTERVEPGEVVTGSLDRVIAQVVSSDKVVDDKDLSFELFVTTLFVLDTEEAQDLFDTFDSMQNPNHERWTNPDVIN